MNKIEIRNFFETEKSKPYFISLLQKIELERKNYNIVPSKENWLAAFKLIQSSIKIIILGQDPYPHKDVADGLAFSSALKNYFPKSLQNIFKEIKKDFPNTSFKSYSLKNWAKQGVLLLNTILTTRENQILAHKDIFEYRIFIDAFFEKLSQNKQKYIFVLLGQKAIDFKEKINLQKDIIITRSHPSPLSYSRSTSKTRAFENSSLFKEIEQKLKLINEANIDWSTN